MENKQNSWAQIFRTRASVYALDEAIKQWVDRGTSGTLIMVQNAQNRRDTRIKWEKNQIEIWWRLTSSKLKAKGKQALVLKAWATSTNCQEILAIRFADQESAVQFAKKYHDIFPTAISGSDPIENIFQQNSAISNQNNKRNVISLPAQQNYNKPLPVLPHRNNKPAVYSSIPQLREPNNNNIKKEWKCTVCTYTNQHLNIKCQMCGLPNALKYNNDHERNMSEDPSMNDSKNNDHFESTVEDFSRAASDIACYNDAPSQVFSTLRAVTKNLLRDDARYRTLDTKIAKVRERLIGFEGVLDFLMLLGFESDALGMKLICQKKPSEYVIHNAITVLNSYQQRFRMTTHAVSEGIDTDNTNDIVNNENPQNKNDTLTLEQIIIWATHEYMQDNDNMEMMETLIMTHTMFTDSLTLLKELRKRFFVPIPPDILQSQDAQQIKEYQTSVLKRIQLKVIKALIDWMKHYWRYDFDGHEPVQTELQEWLKELSVYNELDKHNINCIWVPILCSSVKKEYLRLKNMELKNEMNILCLFEDIDVRKKNSDQFLSESTAQHLAEQITLMDYLLFSRIEPGEYIKQRWKDPNKQQLAPNILAFLQQFNKFIKFMEMWIFCARSLKKRVAVIQKIINMGIYFKLLRNYNALCAVYSVLDSAPIIQLTSVWNKIPKKQKQIHEEWKVLFDPNFNNRNLRKELRRSGGNPCVPLITVYLQDLIFIDQGNKEKFRMLNFNSNTMLNFNKCVRIGDRIKNIQLFSDHPYNPYSKIIKKRETQKILLLEFEKLKDLTDEQIWALSTEINSQDKRELDQKIFKINKRPKDDVSDDDEHPQGSIEFCVNYLAKAFSQCSHDSFNINDHIYIHGGVARDAVLENKINDIDIMVDLFYIQKHASECSSDTCLLKKNWDVNKDEMLELETDEKNAKNEQDKFNKFLNRVKKHTLSDKIINTRWLLELLKRDANYTQNCSQTKGPLFHGHAKNVVTYKICFKYGALEVDIMDVSCFISEWNWNNVFKDESNKYYPIKLSLASLYTDCLFNTLSIKLSKIMDIPHNKWEKYVDDEVHIDDKFSAKTDLTKGILRPYYKDNNHYLESYCQYDSFLAEFIIFRTIKNAFKLKSANMKSKKSPTVYVHYAMQQIAIQNYDHWFNPILYKWNEEKYDSVLRHAFNHNYFENVDDDTIIGIYHMMGYDVQILYWYQQKKEFKRKLNEAVNKYGKKAQTVWQRIQKTAKAGVKNWNERKFDKWRPNKMVTKSCTFELLIDGTYN